MELITMNTQLYNHEGKPKKIIRRKAVKLYQKKKSHKSIEELFAGFQGEYEPVEIDWGEPVGKEIW
jgi:antitoxin component of MazEF toxin-antitoxin module